MPDGLNTYKSTLTPQEVDEALRKIGNVPQSVQQAANYAAAAEDAAERAEAAAGINPDDYPLKVQALARPNLLINSYFSGGGSQLGGDRLPINQRGATSYTSGRCIDMCGVDPSSGGITMTLQPQCIRLQKTSGNGNQSMYLTTPKSFIPLGGTVTLSALVRGTGAARFLLYADSVVTESSKSIQCTDEWNLLSVTFSIPETISAGNVKVFLYADDASHNRYVEYKAVKLESGATQSLAYQDSSGAWDMLPQPDLDYTAQLSKCQRFFLRMNFSQSATIANAFRGTTWYSIVIPLQAPMYKNPTVTWTCAPKFVTDAVAVPAPAVSMPGSYLVWGSALSTASAKGDYVFASVPGYIDINAELV